MKRIDTIIKDGLKSLLRKTRIFWVGVLLLVVAFVVIFGATKLYFHYLEPTASFASDKERIETEDQLRRTVLQILGGLVVAFGLYLTYRRIKASERQVEAFRKQITVAEDGQITERFTRAVEQLGNENIHIRLGGIYALERLANDSDKDHGTVMEVLAAFVRQKRPLKPMDDSIFPALGAGKLINLDEDIFAALTVLGRRKIIAGEEPPNFANTSFPLANLSRIKLPGVSLVGADLRRVNLLGANLLGVNLLGASLLGANLGEAHLEGADLRWANLQETTLWGANLERANLQWANLQRAILDQADLLGADLYAAKLQGAYLGEAKNLTAERLSQAKTLYNATLAPELEKELRETHPHLFEEPKEE